MILTERQVRAGDLALRTGWTVKPEGACRDERCVPLPDLPATVTADTMIDVAPLAERLGMPLVHDEVHGVWALGPEAGGRVLARAEMPPLTLPDVDGNPFDLASLRGQKVVLVAWASW